MIGRYDFRNSSSSLAIFAAIRRASLRVSSLLECQADLENLDRVEV